MGCHHVVSFDCVQLIQLCSSYLPVSGRSLVLRPTSATSFSQTWVREARAFVLLHACFLMMQYLSRRNRLGTRCRRGSFVRLGRVLSVEVLQERLQVLFVLWSLEGAAVVHFAQWRVSVNEIN